MSRYSYLRKRWPEFLGNAFARNERLHDTDFLGAYLAIEPPLLPPLATSTLTRILQPTRGRPLKDAPSQTGLIDLLLETNRPDVPPLFVEALVARLRGEVSLVSKAERIRGYKLRERKWLRGTIYDLYLEFYEKQDGVPFVTHEVFGRVDVPQGVQGRSNRAFVMVQNTIRERLNLHPPSVETMRNVITRENKYWAQIVSERREFSR